MELDGGTPHVISQVLQGTTLPPEEDSVQLIKSDKQFTVTYYPPATDFSMDYEG